MRGHAGRHSNLVAAQRATDAPVLWYMREPAVWSTRHEKGSAVAGMPAGEICGRARAGKQAAVKAGQVLYCSALRACSRACHKPTVRVTGGAHAADAGRQGGEAAV